MYTPEWLWKNYILAPQQFSTFNIIPIPKKGNLSLPGSYRGIVITSFVAKIINKVFLNKICPCIDPHLRGNQSGFRPGRSTTIQTLALRRIIEEVEKNNLPAVMVFIDFCKAFDSISHKFMFSILKAYGIPQRLLNPIQQMYSNLQAKVVTPDGETDLFNITAGVMQGDTLAPFLFVIVLDFALRRQLTARKRTTVLL